MISWAFWRTCKPIKKSHSASAFRRIDREGMAYTRELNNVLILYKVNPAFNTKRLKLYS